MIRVIKVIRVIRLAVSVSHRCSQLGLVGLSRGLIRAVRVIRVIITGTCPCTGTRVDPADHAFRAITWVIIRMNITTHERCQFTQGY